MVIHKDDLSQVNEMNLKGMSIPGELVTTQVNITREPKPKMLLDEEFNKMHAERLKKLGFLVNAPY